MNIKYLILAIGASPRDILSRSRERAIQDVRQCLMYFLYFGTKNNLTEIGLMMGRSYSTVHHSIKKINDMIEIRDKRTIELLYKIEEAHRIYQ